MPRPTVLLREPNPSLAASLADAFSKALTQHGRPREGFDEQVRNHVRAWLIYWSGEPEERVRRLVDIKVAGWPRIAVQVAARCAGGDALLDRVRAAGGIMDL